MVDDDDGADEDAGEDPVVDDDDGADEDAGEDPEGDDDDGADDGSDVLRNPGGDFLAAGVAQFSDYMTFGSALGRVMSATGRSTQGPQTVSRALQDFSTTTLPFVWLQTSTQNSTYATDGRDVDTNVGALRFGAALPLADLAKGRLIGGLEFGAASLSSNIETELTSAAVETKARDVTLSGLWIAENLFYTDVQLRYARFDSTITPNGGTSVDVEGTGYGLSLEMGQPFDVQHDLTLIPQVQIMYSDLDIDDVVNLGGGDLSGSLQDGDSLTARLGLRAEKTTMNGSMLFGQIDYFRAFDHTTSVDFGTDSVATALEKDSIALTLGGHLAVSETTTLFGEVTGAKDLGSNGSSRSLSARLGLQMRF